MTHGAVRAIVVDDSPTERALLVHILRDGGIDVVGEATDGAQAVAIVRQLRPNVVVMDIHMPGVDGFEATRRIMAETPTPIVIVTATEDPGDVTVGLRATQLGALTAQAKPPGPSAAGFEAAAARFAAVVRAMADVKVVGRRGGRGPTAEGSGDGRPRPRTSDRAVLDRRVDVVGVGASTGGPNALYEFLAHLPADLPVPVLVVQHLPEGFTDGFVRWLDSGASLPVRAAEHGATLRAGAVHVAPHGKHLTVAPGRRVGLVDGAPVQGFRPSVSALFSSLASTYGSGAAAVVLTGMGSDGLEGARHLRSRHGLVLVQDEASSVVFGMPRAVAEAGIADLVGSVKELATAVGRMTSRKAIEE